jgi:hypothetical protein
LIYWSLTGNYLKFSLIEDSKQETTNLSLGSISQSSEIRFINRLSMRQIIKNSHLG